MAFGVFLGCECGSEPSEAKDELSVRFPWQIEEVIMGKRCSCIGDDFPGNAHCTVCCVSFAGEKYFEWHLVRGGDGRVSFHLSVEQCGYVKSKRGTWGPPDNKKPKILVKNRAKYRQ